MSFKFTVSGVVPATPMAVYDAWLNSKAHGAMTGTKAKASNRVGGKWSASDDYCYGVNLELVPGKKIVQSWRSTDFADDDKDSRISLNLKPVKDGTRLTLLHSSIPESQADSGYKEGWMDYYFEPMKKYFEALSVRRTVQPGRRPKPKKAAARRKK